MTEPLRQALAGRYKVEREIGRGGMAVVYLAHDLRHDRRVALKLLQPMGPAPSAPERFEREIYFAARLQHPHILTVLDSGEIPGEPGSGATQRWFTMPYVEGESLRERLRREHQLPLDVALRITTEAARALDYAHQQGVIHRDVKPENILLTRDGSTLVGDFGIARAAGSEDTLTRTGMAIGTPIYMSPEQSDSQEADARSDQYSLATVLYEMLAGEPPFFGRSLQAIVAKRLEDPTPSVQVRRPEIPSHVDAAIRRAMAPEPGARFGSLAEFGQALGQRRSSRLSFPFLTRLTRGRRRLSMAVLIATAVVLVGAGAVAAWWLRGSGVLPDTGRVVAVLPFDNLGDSADAYFADGVADEVRTKLAQFPGLEVIARGSSLEYRHTTRRPTEIARQLGADYLLTGTVRWDKGAAGSRVRVTPELVDARPGREARTRWVQQFDASLTDVFVVQADIASKVAAALGLALADSAQRELRSVPTASLPAYDAFLKGEAAAGDMKADQANLRLAIGFYERAVALDSTFVLAWSQLSRARTSLYSNGVPAPELGDAARRALERARGLKPNDLSVLLAAGDYYGSVNPIDNARAAAEYERGLKISPDNVDLLGSMGSTEASLGRWNRAAARMARAAHLDPRSANAVRRLAIVQTFLRNYPAADSAVDRAILLAPTSPGMVSLKVMVALGRGDLASARAVIRAATPVVGGAILFPFLAAYQDLYWVLDDAAQRQVLEAPPSAFDGDRGSWGIVRAELYQLRGDRPRMLIFADSARQALVEHIRSTPEDAQRHALFGLALAYLGRKDEAIRAGRRGVELMPISRDGYFGPYMQLQLARIYLMVGEPERALDQLEPLLNVPFYLSKGWLRVDPTFAGLRRMERFGRLTGE